jgi:hypothetical protein
MSAIYFRAVSIFEEKCFDEMFWYRRWEVVGPLYPFPVASARFF